MQPAVRTGFALSWASANGTALPPPSAAALARAALLLTAPAVPVRSLAETLVGTATTLARVLAACTPHSVACALTERLRCASPQLHPQQGLVAVYGVTRPREDDDADADAQGALSAPLSSVVALPGPMAAHARRCCSRCVIAARLTCGD